MALHTILVPYNLGALRHGTGAGPEALAASGCMDGLAVAASTTIELASQASNEIERCFQVDAALAHAARRARERGEVPVVLSGNCHACLGTLAALERPAAVVWFDAHGDVNTPDTTITGFFDGMALATALGWCWNGLAREIPRFAAVREDDVLLAGGRDLDPAERDRLEGSQICHYAPPPRAVAADADAAFAAALRTRGPARVAYVHLDLDVIDPSELWANRFKVPEGVSVTWLEAALVTVRERYEIGAVGVSAYDPSCTAPGHAAPIVNRLLTALLGTTG